MIKVDVHSTRADLREQEPLTVGLRGAKVRFAFAEDWTDLIKTAVFRQADKTVTVADIGEEVTVPWEVLTLPGVPVQIGVYGADAAGTVAIPTLWTQTEPVCPGADPEGDPSTEYSPGFWDQMQRKLGSLEQLQTNEKSSLVAAINEANRPVCLITVYDPGDGTYISDYNVQAIRAKMDAGVPIVCYWYEKEVVLPLTNFQSDHHVSFAAVYDAVEYKVVINENGVRCYSVELMKNTKIPAKTSDLENDSGYLTEAPVTSVNGQTGDITFPTPVKVIVEQNEDGTYSASPSCAEIVDAHNAGNTVYCQYGTRLLPLVIASRPFCAFSGVYSGNVYTVEVSQSGVKVTVTALASGTVKTVNGVGPDGNGNVQIDTGTAGGEPSVFAGKTASFYGDSLTAVNYHYTKGYHAWVKDILGLASYHNYGKSGYTVSDVYNKVNSVTDTADIIFVMCGVNDQNFSVPLGAMGDTASGTTYGALDLLCAKLKQKYPTKLVVFITPHYQTNYKHSGGVTSYEVSKAIREVCEKYAIPVYDNFVLSGIYSTNLSAFTTDNCHWNDAAHEMVGKNLARFMLSTFRYVHTSDASSHTHSYTEAVTTAPTCTEAGVKTFTCECGDSDTQSIPATGHIWDAGIVTVEPTETTEGVRTYTCTVCGETRTETIPAIEEHTHSYVSTLVAPTCTEQGYTEHVCSCGDSYKDTYVDATGHHYVDGFCSACGEKDADYSVPVKTAEITGIRSNGFHVTLYVTKDALPSIDGTATWGFRMKPITDFTVSAANQTGGVYCVKAVNDLTAGYDSAASGFKPTTVQNEDGTCSVSATKEISFTASRAYWAFPILLYQAVGNQFELSDYYVAIDGREYPVYAIGGAFAAETMNLTDAE